MLPEKYGKPACLQGFSKIPAQLRFLGRFAPLLNLAAGSHAGALEQFEDPVGGDGDVADQHVGFDTA